MKKLSTTTALLLVVFMLTGAVGVNYVRVATSANIASAIVARDASGNFSAGTITAEQTSGSTQLVAKDTNSLVTDTSFQAAVRGVDSANALAWLCGITNASNLIMNVGTFCNGALNFYVNSTVSGYVNTSGNWTLGATDIASTKAKLAVGGATMSKVFGVNQEALIPTPTAGYSTQYVRTLPDGKDHVIMKFDDGSTAEICVQP